MHAARKWMNNMGALLDHQVIKSIGSNGQIWLGKEHAGHQVLVETP